MDGQGKTKLQREVQSRHLDGTPLCHPSGSPKQTPCPARTDVSCDVAAVGSSAKKTPLVVTAASNGSAGGQGRGFQCSSTGGFL